jgi:hypothetical protein
LNRDTLRLACAAEQCLVSLPSEAPQSLRCGVAWAVNPLDKRSVAPLFLPHIDGPGHTRSQQLTDRLSCQAFLGAVVPGCHAAVGGTSAKDVGENGIFFLASIFIKFLWAAGCLLCCSMATQKGSATSPMSAHVITTIVGGATSRRLQQLRRQKKQAKGREDLPRVGRRTLQ